MIATIIIIPKIILYIANPLKLPFFKYSIKNFITIKPEIKLNNIPNKNGIENFDKILDALHFTDDEWDEWCPMEQYTPSGGKHIIFASDDELKNVANGSNVFEKYPGIDIRTDGYIVVEPSVIGDKKYSFDTIPMEPPKMPKKLKKFILENANKKTENKKTPYEKPKEVFKGDRDNSLFNYINHLYFKTPLDKDEITTLAKEFNANFDEPLSEKDVNYKIKKCFEKSRGEFLVVRIPEEEL